MKSTGVWGNSALNFFRFGLRICRLANGAAHHDVVGAIFERLLDLNRAFLVIDLPVFDWPDAWAHDEELATQVPAELGSFEARGNDTVTADLQSALRARKNQ